MPYDTSAATPLPSSEAIDLLSLLQIVEGRLRGLSGFWVKGEVAEIRTDATRGHTYLTLIQKTGEGRMAAIAASIRATIWASNRRILEEFRAVTGKNLSSGMTVVVHAAVNYNPRYGLSLNIDTIDYDYSIGQRERQKRETLRYLTETGLIRRQAGLPLPFLPQRIAVVSSPMAAGYGDFIKHLKENPRRLSFRGSLFPATMQGDAAPQSIAGAIRRAVEAGCELILVLRGGGADSDLFCFDERPLCEAVCLCPVPVLSAVGHERDRHVIDDCARLSFKTPTAAADWLVEEATNAETRMEGLRDAIALATRERRTKAERAIEGSTRNIAASAHRCNEHLQEAVALPLRNITAHLDEVRQDTQRRAIRLQAAIAGAIRTRSESRKAAAARRQAAIAKAATGRARAREKETATLATGIAFAAKAIVREQEMRATNRLALINASDPRNILRQGYVLAVDEKGNVLKGASSRKAGETFILRHQDGQWGCTVNTTKKTEKTPENL